jgi:hypothetical protein
MNTTLHESRGVLCPGAGSRQAASFACAGFFHDFGKSLLSHEIREAIERLPPELVHRVQGSTKVRGEEEHTFLHALLTHFFFQKIDESIKVISPSPIETPWWCTTSWIPFLASGHEVPRCRAQRVISLASRLARGEASDTWKARKESARGGETYRTGSSSTIDKLTSLAESFMHSSVEEGLRLLSRELLPYLNEVRVNPEDASNGTLRLSTHSMVTGIFSAALSHFFSGTLSEDETSFLSDSRVDIASFGSSPQNDAPLLLAEDEYCFSLLRVELKGFFSELARGLLEESRLDIEAQRAAYTSIAETLKCRIAAVLGIPPEWACVTSSSEFIFLTGYSSSLRDEVRQVIASVVDEHSLLKKKDSLLRVVVTWTSCAVKDFVTGSDRSESMFLSLLERHEFQHRWNSFHLPSDLQVGVLPWTAISESIRISDERPKPPSSNVEDFVSFSLVNEAVSRLFTRPRSHESSHELSLSSATPWSFADFIHSVNGSRDLSSVSVPFFQYGSLEHLLTTSLLVPSQIKSKTVTVICSRSRESEALTLLERANTEGRTGLVFLPPLGVFGENLKSTWITWLELEMLPQLAKRLSTSIRSSVLGRASAVGYNGLDNHNGPDNNESLSAALVDILIDGLSNKGTSFGHRSPSATAPAVSTHLLKEHIETSLMWRSRLSLLSSLVEGKGNGGFDKRPQSYETDSNASVASPTYGVQFEANDCNEEMISHLLHTFGTLLPFVIKDGFNFERSSSPS